MFELIGNKFPIWDSTHRGTSLPYISFLPILSPDIISKVVEPPLTSKIPPTLSAFTKEKKKLVTHYFGPFEIMNKASSIAYQLHIPSTTKIHVVFHLPALKLCKRIQLLT
ncbi:hypothetical protein MTR_7g074640 [Medicago truncatula]|uniref:Tf2-1-like SH3-like domain-containing protein n=1 Tax=Medicago truncatula TaxID=3880 RepID=G7KZA0_MEDTR|nr:hypothetical protein MTR_7g074640 [Medicago truncatula]